MTSSKKETSKWPGPNSVFSGLYGAGVMDEKFVEEYTGKIIDAQNHQLDPLKYDLADWINRTVGFLCVSGENFFNELENGAILCYLAQVIKTKAKMAITAGLTRKQLPKTNKKYFDNAIPGSFFSRDNIENFIKFCQSVKVHENLLFESDDLVLHRQPRNVILCLLEVARLSTNYGIEPPNLIQLEKEILKEEAQIALQSDSSYSQLCWQFESLPSRFECENLPRCNSSSPSSVIEPIEYKKYKQLKSYESINEGNLLSLPTLSAEVALEIDQLSKSSGKDSHFETKLLNESDRALDELDMKVEQAARLLHLNCKCANRRYVKLKIKKIGEGKYMIAGRNVFVRMLKNCRMMVRVGGGWDTLDHFLKRHDPCQAELKECKPLTRKSTPNITKKYSYYSSFKKILRPGESAI